MTALRLRLLGPMVAFGVVACAPPHGGGVSTAAPAVTPVAHAPLIAVLDHPFGATPNTLRLLRPDGVEVARAGVDPEAEAVAAAGSRVLLAGAGHLMAVGRDGGLTVLPPLPGDAASDLVRGLVADPAGIRWMWASVAQSPAGTTSRVYSARSAAPSPTLLLQRDGSGTALQPVAWTAGGPVLAEEPLGIGGYVLFRRTFGAAELLDVSTRTLRPLGAPRCAFSDLAADGSLACVVDGREGPHGSGPVRLVVQRPGRTALDLALPASVQQAGAAFFRPGGGELSLATSPARGEGQEQVETSLVDLATGARRAFGPAGIMPAGWLPDGRLLAVRLPGVAGGQPGTYVVASDGTSTLVSSASTVVGVLAG
jgi:hypothetical protein